MLPPVFLTFTGVDEQTDIDEMVRLSSEYPIEWGILLSKSSSGVKPRFPSLWWVLGLLARGAFGPEKPSERLKMSAHFCGSIAREMVGFDRAKKPSLDLLSTMLLVNYPRSFSRFQVNHPGIEQKYWQRLGQLHLAPAIIQCRGDRFPHPGFETSRLHFLFDRSGGAGEVPDHWPKYPGRMVGYAGGIKKENILGVIEQINADGPYWLDMESGVRTDEKFDLKLCREICEIVYPKK